LSTQGKTPKKNDAERKRERERERERERGNGQGVFGTGVARGKRTVMSTLPTARTPAHLLANLGICES
jgi:hypothetical protein